MEKYIFARSSVSASYYPNNKPYDFRVHLDNALDLHGYWKIGISEFFTKTSPTKTVIDKTSAKPVTTLVNFKPLYVFSNICEFSSVSGQEQPILRIIQPDLSYGWNEKFYPIYYIPIKITDLTNLHLYIKDESGLDATFIDSEVWVTLHLIRYPF